MRNDNRHLTEIEVYFLMVKEMKFGYVRVSSRTQNEARQIETLSEYVTDKDKIIVDRASGKNLSVQSTKP